MTKDELVLKVKTKFASFDQPSITMADMQADCSPTINNIGSSVWQLAETLYPTKVEGVLYVHDREIETEIFKYEDLNQFCLEHILDLLEGYNPE